jgi:predicted SAM-dependent methyltransferase
LDQHWINIDAVSYPGVEYLVDFNRMLPFRDDTFDGIFCEHVLEHFSLEQGKRLLADCFRILKPSGTLRLIVPDGGILVEWCLHRPDELVARRPGSFASAMESLNSYFRQRYEHKMIYDEKLLKLVLEYVRFDDVVRTRFRIGAVEELSTMDDEKYREESLYVEAMKPGHRE